MNFRGLERKHGPLDSRCHRFSYLWPQLRSLFLADRVSPSCPPLAPIWSMTIKLAFHTLDPNPSEERLPQMSSTRPITSFLPPSDCNGHAEGPCYAMPANKAVIAFTRSCAQISFSCPCYVMPNFSYQKSTLNKSSAYLFRTRESC